MSDPWKSLAPELPGLLPAAEEGEAPTDFPESGSLCHDPERVDALAIELLKARSLTAVVQAALRRAELKVMACMHQSFGEVACTARGHTHRIAMTRPERWRWDREKLLSIAGGADMPSFISTSYRVNRKRFEALPQDEKDRFLPALEIEAGPWTLEVLPAE